MARQAGITITPEAMQAHADAQDQKEADALKAKIIFLKFSILVAGLVFRMGEILAMPSTKKATSSPNTCLIFWGGTSVVLGVS